MIDEKKLLKEIKNRRNFWVSKASKYDEMNDEINTDICDGKAVELEVVMKMIQEQPKIGEWIPCNKKLPGPYDTVIITAKMPNDKESLVYMGSINAIREWYILGVSNPNDYNVTAWQPLPEPWGGETCLK